VSTSTLPLDELLARAPRVHGGRSFTYSIHPVLARFVDDFVKPGFVTLETGSGLSTLVILRKGVARHIAVAPEADEFAVIREFCSANGMSTTPFEGVVARSERYLPTAPLPVLNLVLVDGDHAFPLPFIDWYYTADHLAVGGVMIVDDIQLVTGRLLADFMDADPKWERVLYEPSRFAAFRKLSHPIHSGNWPDQPYVALSNPVDSITITRQVEYSAPPRGLGAIYSRLPAGVQGWYRRLRAAWKEL
jgi:hypothetical protein